MDSAVIEVQELFGVASSAVGAATPATPAAECTVCMTERCSTALLPCGHVCVCAECGETLRQRRDPCPVCRAPVATFMLLLTTT
jgi:rubrerythrin